MITFFNMQLLLGSVIPPLASTHEVVIKVSIIYHYMITQFADTYFSGKLSSHVFYFSWL